MSLSQKHFGKVLVPWFNCAEWQHVYNLIYSQTSQNWPAALQILKVWKHRTPLLSAGVEGTLIVLESMLVDPSCLSPTDVSNILCTSLVRFLNLSAASGDKQGTFYRKARESELPKWLVNIRHDIAHSHQVPSQNILRFSLKFCLEWLKVKYWDVQGGSMSDFVAGEVDNSVIEDVVKLYSFVREWEKIETSRRGMRLVHKIIKEEVYDRNIMERVHDVLRGEIENNGEKSCDKLSTLLIDNLVMLSDECEIDENGQKRISQEVVQKWGSLLEIILECKIMPNFANRLLNLTCDGNYSFAYRERASLWIKEIFQENTEDWDQLANKNFSIEVLERLSPFTMNFVQEVLQYNNAPPEFIQQSVSLISAFNTNTGSKNYRIYTIEDINMQNDEETEKSNGVVIQSSSRWEIIQDITPFINLPLGILPHQDRTKNPILVT